MERISHFCAVKLKDFTNMFLRNILESNQSSYDTANNTSIGVSITTTPDRFSHYIIKHLSWITSELFDSEKPVEAKSSADMKPSLLLSYFFEMN